MTVHIYKVNCNHPAALQHCGFVAGLTKELERHQTKSSHSGRMTQTHPVSEYLMYREASQLERKRHTVDKQERKRGRDTLLESLD